MSRELDNVIRQGVSAARWLLAPMYLGLGLMLIVLLVQFVRDFFRNLPLVFEMEAMAATGVLLAMCLTVLLAGVVLMVLETALDVLRITGETEAGPRIDFRRLGSRLLGAGVAVSLVSLLQLALGRSVAEPAQSMADLRFSLAILIVLVLSILVIAVADWFRVRAVDTPQD